MISEESETQLALRALGLLGDAEREHLRLAMQSSPELPRLAGELAEVYAQLEVAFTRHVRPSSGLKARILAGVDARLAGLPMCPQLGRIGERLRLVQPGEGFVVTDLDGLVQWVNPAFSDLCGYQIEEIRGRKLGPILQGPATDPAVAARMRAAVRARTSCREEMLNYDKLGTPYWVQIDIQPVCGADQIPVGFTAVERAREEQLAA